MLIEQISIFVENKTGRLAEAINVLKDGGIDLKALTVADTADFGIVRVICDDSAKAMELLKNNSCTASIAKVIVISVSDEPGSLYRVIDILKENDISIKYLYAVTGRDTGNADFVLRVSDNEKAVKLFTDSGIKVISHKELCE